MLDFKIPSKLLEMISDQKTIPFIGAGFSKNLELPDWKELLEAISREIENALPFNEVEKISNNYLEIAEYYLIKSNNQIGPIRYAIQNALKPKIKPIYSGPHVELINLGAKQIYTTNYDDLIEQTFKSLNLQCKSVCNTRDISSISNGDRQIIKYHGDLRYEDTLVLTESSYFSRMELTSPIDIKFRSDILGKSVLFLGYSFNDINIRMIWFKLMNMLKEVPISEKPISYIVRQHPNPVLEELYRSVGIETIILDDKKEYKIEEMNQLFSNFMVYLTSKSS